MQNMKNLQNMQKCRICEPVKAVNTGVRCAIGNVFIASKNQEGFNRRYCTQKKTLKQVLQKKEENRTMRMCHEWETAEAAAWRQPARLGSVHILQLPHTTEYHIKPPVHENCSYRLQ